LQAQAGNLARPKAGLEGAEMTVTAAGGDAPSEVAALPQANTVEPGPEKLVVVSTGSATLETGALETGSPEIGAPTLRINKGASRQVIERRLLERPDDIIAASRGFAEGLKRQADELRASKPNEAGPLAQYDDLIAFLDKMVSGLAELADALDQAFKTTAAAQHPSPEPIFLGKAAEIARRLHLGAMDWLEQNSTTVFNVPCRISTLHWIGADSITAIGTLGYLVRSKEDKKRRQEKKPLGKSEPASAPLPVGQAIDGPKAFAPAPAFAPTAPYRRIHRLSG
jgi:hypothetical protein